jgi:imidazolonepropionase-like amidohydrolase
VAAVVDEAHRRGLRVACHARSAAAVKQAVRAGVDFIGHANYLDDEAVALLAACNETVIVGPAIAWEVQYLAQCESLGVPRAVACAQGYQAEIEATVASVEKLRNAGVRLVVGGDYGISIAPHGTYAKDLEYFVELFGMRPAEALVCATRNGGEAMDPAGSLGTLREGSCADFLVVDGDPLADIRILQDRSRFRVFKGGQPAAA